MQKVVNDAYTAIQDIPDGASIMFGGFGLCGIPENCIAAIAEKNIRDMVCISNNPGVDDFGLGFFLEKKQIRKMIASYIGENKLFEQMLFAGEVELELIPQGTLAERIRAGGCGIPAFYLPAGYGTLVAEGKEVREFNGKMHLMEHALTADYACVKAWKGDTAGNLIYRGTANNFNQAMAMAGKITIAEVEELVPLGTLDPNSIHTPGIFVQRIFQGSKYVKRIEFTTTREN